MVPARLLDTRDGYTTIDGQAQGGGQHDAGSTTILHVTGRGGVPNDATAVVLNVTIADAIGPGFVTVYPCGAPQPLASNLNYTTGSIIPNAVITKIGDNGTVCIFTSNATQLLADVNGYFPNG